MFNSKIASLEARIARLQAVLKSRTASKGSKSIALTKAIKGIDTERLTPMGVLNKIAESVHGVIRTTDKGDGRYLLGDLNEDNTIEAYMTFGAPYNSELYLEVSVTKQGKIYIELTMPLWFPVLDRSLTFNKGDNSWKEKVPALINKAKEDLLHQKKSKTAASGVSPESIEYFEETLHEILSERYAYKGRAGAGAYVTAWRNHTLTVSVGYRSVEITVTPNGVDVHAVNTWHASSEKKHFVLIPSNVDSIIRLTVDFVTFHI